MGPMPAPLELVEKPIPSVDRVLECLSILNESATAMFDSHASLSGQRSQSASHRVPPCAEPQAQLQLTWQALSRRNPTRGDLLI
jgi:hypothetical protein